jgi:hypothetical protein
MRRIEGAAEQADLQAGSMRGKAKRTAVSL